MTPDLDLEPGQRSASRTTTTRTTTVEPVNDVQQETDPLKRKYRHLKANPRRRRALFALIIFLAIVAVAVAAFDILVLRAEKDTIEMADRYIEFGVYGFLGLLLIWAIFLMISGRSGKEPWDDSMVTTTSETETVEQMRARLELERSLMQCPDCKSVFQYGEAHFRDNKRTAFSCPVCGVYSKLPDPDAEPVKVLRPEGEFKELQYHCTNCDEEMAVGTFGETPLHLVRFRACPNCGQRGHIERIGSTPPTPPMDDGYGA